MPVNIHGKQYYTVMERVNLLREQKDNYCITTEIIDSDGPNVIMKASILNMEGVVLATGHAEEVRGSTMINKTSALENCETSAIGRALASFGLGGTEFASANEVENAIAQQRIDNTVEPRQDYIDKAYNAYAEEVENEVFAEEGDFKRMQQINHYLTNDERIAVEKMFGSVAVPGGKKMLKTIVRELLTKTEADNG